MPLKDDILLRKMVY